MHRPASRPFILVASVKSVLIGVKLLPHPLRLFPLRLILVFVQNIFELRRVKYFAARLAFYKLDVLLAGDDADLGMFAR
jgi:type II secretory pathway component PulK